MVDAQAGYFFDQAPDEVARLQSWVQSWEAETEVMLDRIGVLAGWHAVDLAFRPRFLEWGLIGAGELDRLLHECERIARDPKTFLTSFTVVQVWGHNPQ